MSRPIVWPAGLHQAHVGWETDPFFWMLVTGAWTQDETTQQWVSDITAFEFTDPTYNRQTVTSPVIQIELALVIETPGFVRFLSDAPSFGVLDGFEVAESLVLAADLGSDAVSPLVYSFPINYEANNYNPADFVVSSEGTLEDATFCAT